MDTGAVIAGNSYLDYGEMTANLVAAYVSHNRIAASEVPALISAMAAAFTGLQTSDQSAVSGSRRVTPAQIQASIRHEALISFEDGKPYKTIKRHLRACGLTPETYRAKWGLPSDYPMVAPAYGAERSRIAKSLAMGRHQAVR
ncbi:MucR family transcriptional regulator [Methylobacterium radiotolerans]|nr:MucR family transcriptional regulator [Methylobacterium radiotolerans]KTS45107.1 MucR family transcriptional regulator [Methylobacterium radiotolerans]